MLLARLLLARCAEASDSQVALATVFVGLATIAGHNYSTWLRGKGGKGVATEQGRPPP